MRAGTPLLRAACNFGVLPPRSEPPPPRCPTPQAAVQELAAGPDRLRGANTKELSSLLYAYGRLLECACACYCCACSALLAAAARP